MTPHSVPLLGVPIHVVTFDEAVDRIVELAHVGRAEGRSHQVVTVNTDFLVNALGDDEVHRMLQHADLAFADGMPLVWASRRLGAPLPERVAGADVVPAVAARSADEGLRVMFFGGAADSAERAATLLRSSHPGLDIVSATGMIDADGGADTAILDHIRETAPDVLCVGLGHPKQERFIVRHRDALGVPVAIGTGATFEFLAGDSQRAPEWMQQRGLEWLHRLLTEPGRLGRRYAKDARVFAPAIARTVRRARRAEHDHPGPLLVDADSVVIDVGSRSASTRRDLVALSSAATRRRSGGHPDPIELRADSRFLADLAVHRLQTLFTLSLNEPPKAAS